jgi:hypothetical protein
MEQKIIWFSIQTVSNKWNTLVENPRIWSWKEIGFVITDLNLIKRLGKFANFADFKGIVEKEFKLKLDEIKRFERGCKVDERIQIVLIDLNTNVEMEVNGGVAEANRMAKAILEK